MVKLAPWARQNHSVTVKYYTFMSNLLTFFIIQG